MSREYTADTRNMGRVRWCFVASCVAAGIVLFESDLKAYADPGSGALLWQILVGVISGVMYLVRRFLTRFSGRNSIGSK